MILTGDIGGTKTHLALFDEDNNLLIEQKHASSDWTCLKDVIYDFLRSSGVNLKDVTAGCLGLAGPIQGHLCTLVNLNRVIDLDSLQKSLKFRSPITFCNDLVAIGHGIFTLKSSDLYCLNPESKISQDNKDNYNMDIRVRAVIAPGTGLGESVILSENNVYPTEGAHVDFAPQSELEIKLWRFLFNQFGHVSYDRILSGPGLVHIYRFLQNEMPVFSNNAILSSEEISNKALAKSCPLSIKTLDLFVKILGSEAGNLALKTLALGGVYLGGGIPPKILPKLKDGPFLKSFQDKGRLSEIVRGIPVYVILTDRAALYGAAKISNPKNNSNS